MSNKFSENYKKELMSKALDYLVKTDEYKCILNEDLESIKNHYYHAWENIKEDELNSVVKAIENDFKEEFMKKGYLWDTLRDAFDSVVVEILDYSYIVDNMWSKNIKVAENYYIHMLKCALEDKINYSIEETIEEDNSFLTIKLDYIEDYQKYKPLLICYTDIINSSCDKNKVITNIFTDSEFGFSEGLHVYKDDIQENNIYNNEICNLIMQLLERERFNYILSKDRVDLSAEEEVKNANNLSLKDLLMKLDTEIGSTINYASQEKIVLDNMKRANILVRKIADMLGIEF